MISPAHRGHCVATSRLSIWAGMDCSRSMGMFLFVLGLVEWGSMEHNLVVAANVNVKALYIYI